MYFCRQYHIPFSSVSKHRLVVLAHCTPLTPPSHSITAECNHCVPGTPQRRPRCSHPTLPPRVSNPSRGSPTKPGPEGGRVCSPSGNSRRMPRGPFFVSILGSALSLGRRSTDVESISRITLRRQHQRQCVHKLSSGCEKSGGGREGAAGEP